MRVLALVLAIGTGCAVMLLPADSRLAGHPLEWPANVTGPGGGFAPELLASVVEVTVDVPPPGWRATAPPISSARGAGVILDDRDVLTSSGLLGQAATCTVGFAERNVTASVGERLASDLGGLVRVHAQAPLASIGGRAAPQAGRVERLQLGQPVYCVLARGEVERPVLLTNISQFWRGPSYGLGEVALPAVTGAEGAPMFDAGGELLGVLTVERLICTELPRKDSGVFELGDVRFPWLLFITRPDPPRPVPDGDRPFMRFRTLE